MFNVRFAHWLARLIIQAFSPLLGQRPAVCCHHNGPLINVAHEECTCELGFIVKQSGARSSTARSILSGQPCGERTFGYSVHR